MIYSQITVPIEIVNEERITIRLWEQLAKEIMVSVGYETKYAMTFRKKIEQDRNTPNVILTLACDIEHSTTSHYVAHTVEMPVISDFKVSRWERFKQFLEGK